jgi:hypothetical protein
MRIQVQQFHVTDYGFMFLLFWHGTSTERAICYTVHGSTFLSQHQWPLVGDWQVLLRPNVLHVTLHHIY